MVIKYYNVSMLNFSAHASVNICRIADKQNTYFLAGKPQYVPKWFDACDPDQPVVQCFKDPCLTSICPAYPEATCRTNLCGSCRPEFLQEGKIVNCSKEFVGLLWYLNIF